MVLVRLVKEEDRLEDFFRHCKGEFIPF